MVCLLAELGWKIVGWLAGLRVSWMCQESFRLLRITERNLSASGANTEAETRRQWGSASQIWT